MKIQKANDHFFFACYFELWFSLTKTISKTERYKVKVQVNTSVISKRFYPLSNYNIMPRSTSPVNAISTHTKVTLPHEEAVKAPFPPGCKVLCFDENGFRVGVVKNVLVFISLQEEARYGTYYEVEIKGANQRSGKTSVFTADDLRLTPDCPVFISPEYFGSVFNNAESEGNIEGIVLGSFEIPPTVCSNCRGNERGQGSRRGKYFYSVRVRFPGMDEAVEAHGVPPEHVMVLNSNENFDGASLTGDSIMIGGGSYEGDVTNGGIDYLEEKRNKTPRPKARRIFPEAIHTGEEDFDQQSVRDGYYQEQFDEASYEKTISPIRLPQSMRNIISNHESHFYDTGSESEYDRQPAPKVKMTRSSSRGRSRPRDHSRGHTNRSVSRTRTYIRSHTPVRARPKRIPNHNSSSLSQDYTEFRDQNGSRSASMKKSVSTARTTEEMSHVTDDDGTRDVNDNEYSVIDIESANSGSYEEQNTRGDLTVEEYDSITFHENDYEYEEETKGTIDNNSTRGEETPRQGKSQRQSPRQNDSADIDSENDPARNTSNDRNATPVRKKAFGKTWSPSNQDNEKTKENAEDEKPKIGKLHLGARSTTPYKVRSSTPVPARNTTPSPAPVNELSAKLPATIPKEGCYLLFDSNSGGRFIVQFSKTVIQDAIGFWAPGPGKKLQGFKFKQNQGRSDLMKGVAGKDYKKKYYSGWCQFVKAAKSYNGYFVKYSEKEHIEVDVYVFFNQSCEIVQIEDAQLFDVSLISAVAVVAKGNDTFDGVKTGEYGTFLGKGAAAGASLGLL